MSFEKMGQDELRAAAEWFAVDLDTAVNAKGNLNPKLAAAAFAEEGVTFDMYTELRDQRDRAARELEEEKLRAAENLQNTIKEEKDLLTEEVEPVADEVVTTKRKPRGPREILVKMDRQNPHYEVNGKVFTREHPFVICTEEEAQAIFDVESGFRVATPREASEYYS